MMNDPHHSKRLAYDMGKTVPLLKSNDRLVLDGDHAVHATADGLTKALLMDTPENHGKWAHWMDNFGSGSWGFGTNCLLRTGW
jgi:hypothetical protein